MKVNRLAAYFLLDFRMRKYMAAVKPQMEQRISRQIIALRFPTVTGALEWCQRQKDYCEVPILDGKELD
jgi:hypothetical protein